MRVRLAYGEHGLPVEVPDDRATVVHPRTPPAVAEPATLLRAALRDPVEGPPLRHVVRRGQSVAVAMCDATRPQPREAMLRAILDELDGVVEPSQVTVLIATGTHRASTPDEIRDMLGAELAAAVRVVDHDSRDASTLRWLGVHGDGVPVWLNRAWTDADIRITTGFVEPHFFAGFSGGPKLVAPGLAALETVLTLHDARRIGHPKATWGICTGNPVHDDVRAIAAATGVDFGFDVILDREQRIAAAFGGPVLRMHAAAREVVRRLCMVEVPQRYDVVVTSNSGYPLDRNLYQAVKGMSAAAAVVKPGGEIICAAECRDGMPDHGSFREVLSWADTPTGLLDAIAAVPRTVPDQWQAQVLARVLAHARVRVHSSYLDAGQLAAAQLEPCDDVSAAVRDALDRAGPGASVCVLPDGPQTIAYPAR